MQKKLIALAVAGLASTAAFAQTNVTIYGLVDVGASYRWDSYADQASIGGIDSGISAGNRLGFKGTEDLGNGLKAIFLLESGFGVDTGVSAQGGRLFGRQAYAGLTGGFGTLVFGRQYSPYYTAMLAMDPFVNGTVGAYSNAWGWSSMINVQRLDNTVAYVSPSFGGFTLTGAFSSNADVTTCAANINGECTTAAGAPLVAGLNTNPATQSPAQSQVYAVMGRFQNFGLDAGVNYHYIAVDNAGMPAAFGATNNVQNATFFAAYDAKFLKVSAAYAWNKLENQGVAATNIEVNNLLVGLNVPIGKFAIQASYNYSDGKDGISDAQQYAIGGTYALSKRTNLYTAYSFVDTNCTATNYNTSGCRYLGTVPAMGDGSSAGGSYQQGLQLGVKHMF
jgi:predicted porin